MQKILQIITLSEWGGAQQVCYDLVTNLDKDKFSVEVACAPGGELVPRLHEQEIVVRPIDSLKRDISPLNDLTALFKLFQLIREGGYDIVHCHSTKAGLLGRIAAWLARTPKRFFTVHGWGFYNTEEYGYMQKLLIAAEKVSAKISSKNICVSNQVKQDGLERGIAPQDKFEIIRNGTPWNAPGQNGHLRKELGVEEADTLFGMVARLAYPKDPILFLQAARKVVEQEDAAKFVLIGDGPLCDDGAEFVKKNNLEDKITLLGFREDARALLQDLDVFVLASKFEALPMTIIEAMFASLPVIATDVGGIDELIKNGRNGFLTQQGDSESMAEKMIYLAENSENRDKMGQKNKDFANKNLTVDRMVEEYEELYLS